MTTRTYRFAAFAGGAAALATLWLARAGPGADGPAQDNTARIRAGDRLYLHASDTLPDQPIKGVYRVEPSGQVPLGPAYGRVQVTGLTPEEAEARVRDHLGKRLRESPPVSLTWYDRAAHGGPDLQDRVAKLEKELGELRTAVERLRKP